MKTVNGLMFAFDCSSGFFAFNFGSNSTPSFTFELDMKDFDSSRMQKLHLVRQHVICLWFYILHSFFVQ